MNSAKDRKGDALVLKFSYDLFAASPSTRRNGSALQKLRHVRIWSLAFSAELKFCRSLSL